jgi:hypothetical protein
MNNKGQTLVLFVILIPVLLLVFVCFYQIGSIGLDKRKIEDSIETALEYGVDHIDSELLYVSMREIITESNNGVRDNNIDIDVLGDEITIVVKKKYKVAFIVDEEKVYSYTGKKVNDKVEIVENRG